MPCMANCRCTWAAAGADRLRVAFQVFDFLRGSPAASCAGRAGVSTTGNRSRTPPAPAVLPRLHRRPQQDLDQAGGDLRRRELGHAENLLPLRHDARTGHRPDQHDFHHPEAQPDQVRQRKHPRARHRVQARGRARAFRAAGGKPTWKTLAATPASSTTPNTGSRCFATSQSVRFHWATTNCGSAASQGACRAALRRRWRPSICATRPPPKINRPASPNRSSTEEARSWPRCGLPRGPVAGDAGSVPVFFRRRIRPWKELGTQCSVIRTQYAEPATVRNALRSKH